MKLPMKWTCSFGENYMLKRREEISTALVFLHIWNLSAFGKEYDKPWLNPTIFLCVHHNLWKLSFQVGFNIWDYFFIFRDVYCICFFFFQNMWRCMLRWSIIVTGQWKGVEYGRRQASFQHFREVFKFGKSSVI